MTDILHTPTRWGIDTIDIILFDLGGVLVELSGIPTMLEWTRNKYNVEELGEIWLQSPSVRSFETGRSTPDRFAKDVITEMDLPVTKDEFIQRFTHWPMGLFPGVPELLDRLKPDYRLACFSNSNSLHWPVLMDDMALKAKFNNRFGSHLIGKVKPDKEAFAYVINQLKCKPSSILFLDDNILNVQSAKEIGMVAYCVKGPGEIERVLEKTGISISKVI